MIGKTLKQADLDRLGLKPTGDFYGTTEVHRWQYYSSSKVTTILRENVDGTFLVQAWVRS